MPEAMAGAWSSPRGSSTQRSAAPASSGDCAWLNNRAISSIIAGPRTFDQWTSYFAALDYEWTAEDEQLADSLVVPGHASTPGFTDPAYPVEGRFPAVG